MMEEGPAIPLLVRADGRIEAPDRFARWILDELEDEQRWDESFAGSQGALAKLAGEARRAVERGESEELDPAKL